MLVSITTHYVNSCIFSLYFCETAKDLKYCQKSISVMMITTFHPYKQEKRGKVDIFMFAGSPSGNNLTPVGPCRYDSSLGN